MRYNKDERYFYSQLDRQPIRFNQNTMMVEGNGTVTAIPDQALIKIGIITEATNVIDAQTQNSSISNQVIEALKRSGIPTENLRTAQYSVQPIYQYVEGKTILKGYEVRHLLEVQLNDLTKIGAVLNIATENGANQIQDVIFKSSKPETAYRKALQIATVDAIGKANEIAKTLHVQLNEIPIKIEEKSTPLYEPKQMEKMVLSSTSESVPIQLGELKYTATIKAVFGYIS